MKQAQIYHYDTTNSLQTGRVRCADQLNWPQDPTVKILGGDILRQSVKSVQIGAAGRGLEKNERTRRPLRIGLRFLTRKKKRFAALILFHQFQIHDLPARRKLRTAGHPVLMAWSRLRPRACDSRLKRLLGFPILLPHPNKFQQTLNSSLLHQTLSTSVRNTSTLPSFFLPFLSRDTPQETETHTIMASATTFYDFKPLDSTCD